MVIYTPASAAKAIPVIDLTGSFSRDTDAKKVVAWEVHKACRETGFFYVSNHGVPQDLLDKQLECARRFFDLPQAEKLKLDVAHSPSMRGYEPMSSQTLDDGSQPDLKEGFMAGVDGKQAYTTNGEFNSLNQWPASYGEMSSFRTPIRPRRYAAVLFGGAMSGLAGAYYCAGYVLLWQENMVAGRGWMAIALVLFAGWRPIRLVFGAVFFGAITAVQFQAQTLGIEFPSQLLAAIPYLATIGVLTYISSQKKATQDMPRSLGRTFHPIVSKLV